MPNWKKLVVSGSDAALNSVLFSTSPSPVPTQQGSLYFDTDNQALSAVLNGYIQKIGEDQFYPVKNQTGTLIPKGTAVQFAGTVGNSGRLLIAPFLANGSVSSTFFMGVTAENIANGADGKVLWFGRIRGINTNAFNEGDVLYASTTNAGAFQTAVPQAPNNIVQVAAVINSHANNGTIFVRPTIGSNINKDEGVKITSPTVGNILQLQSTGLWENKTLAQAGIQPTITNPITGTGTSGQVSYWNGTTTQTGGNLTWDNSNKILQTTGAGTIRTSTGNLTLATAAGNGNIILSPHGTGNVLINTTSALTGGGRLQVNGDININKRILSGQENLIVNTGALRLIAQISSTNHDAAFFDYVIKKGTNLRAGTVYAVHNGTTVEFTETSTNDLGNTNEVKLSVDLSGGNIRLLAQTDTNDWQIKALVRGL